MERGVFPLLLISGLCSLSSCLVQHKYLFITESKTWLEAQSYCREKCIDLVTIRDMEEMQAVLGLIESKDYDGVWIGIHKVGFPSWHSTLTHKKEERNYWNLKNDTGNCALYSGGKAKVERCKVEKHSVCFDGRKHGPEQYVLISSAMQWNAAQDHCRIHHTDLFGVKNRREEEMLAETAGNEDLWIGNFKDSYEWSDQTYSSFRYWSGVKTSLKDRCGALLKSEGGKWGKVSCIETHGFVCTCPIKRIIKIRVMLQDSALDLNDPTVQDQILKQIRLKQSFVSEGDAVQVRWRKHPDGKVFTKEAN